MVHPSPLMFSEIYLRLEPLGLEMVAGAARAAGHDVRLLDLQIFRPDDYRRALDEWRPEAVCFSVNYLANVPEVIDLARLAKQRRPGCAVVVGGHSASFTADEMLAHADDAIDCVVRGEGEGVIGAVLDAVTGGGGLLAIPGVVTRDGSGPPPALAPNLERWKPARDLTRR